MRTRKANIDDLAAIATINREVQALHVTLAPDIFRAELDVAAVVAFFARILSAPRHSLFVADHRGVVEAYAWVEVQQRPATPFSHARTRLFVHHIGVLADARRRGVASALLAAAEQEGRSAGAHEMALDTWTGNEVARAFFAARGLHPTRVGLVKPLA